MEKFELAQICYSKALEKGGEENESFKSLEGDVTRNYIRVHYDELTKDLKIKVRYIDGKKGKGI
jgi:hypothetical protein